MKTHRFGVALARWCVGLGTLPLLGLASCADTHWERSFYQGARHGNAQCELRRRPTDAPCAELLDYDRYQQERTKAMHASPPSTQESSPIQETQQ